MYVLVMLPIVSIRSKSSQILVVSLQSGEVIAANLRAEAASRGVTRG